METLVAPMTTNGAVLVHAEHWVGGSADSSAPGGVRPVIDPATGTASGDFAVANSVVVDRAVRAASDAGPAWWALGGEERSRLLVAAADRLSAAAYDLAVLESLEMGKPVAMAQEDIEGSAEMFRAAAEAAATFFAPATPAGSGLRRRPYGVAALVTPWNYPVCQVTDILGGLLAAGNTVVVKPSEKAPLSVAALGPLLDVLPAGVVNIVLGDGAAGAALVEHPLVGLVHFTGSVATGRKVGAAAGARLIPCFLELGGKDALVVDRDVDVAKAAELAAAGGWINTGQVCTSVERVYVHRDIADDFVAELTNQAASWTVGPGTEPATRMGPLVDAGQRDLVHRQVFEAQLAGAEVAVGGEPLPGPGFFYPPTVVVGAPDDSRLMTEETFGPVIGVRVVDSFEEGVRLADTGAYGLTAAALTNDPAHVELAAALDAGVVTINGGGDHPADAPFEPARASGMGRVYLGPRALESFTRPYGVSIGGIA
jgi:succinate-semialdehyde dehydrogenase/glutarate-semialdehyde dehydrogenase